MRIFSIIFLVVLFCLPASAQYYTDTLVSETVVINRYSTKEFKVSLEKGDQILLDFSVEKERNLTSILFIYPSGRELQMKKENKIEEKIIDIFEKGEYTLRLTNGLLSSRKCFVQLRKILPIPKKIIPPPPFVPIRDTTYTTEKITKLVSADTAKMIVSEVSVYAPPTMNISQIPRASIKIELPPEIDYWAFWIGADEQALKAYNDFSGTIPATWAANALEAYGVGKVTSIPSNTNGEKIKYFFADEFNQQQFLAGNSYQPYPVRQGYDRMAYGKVNAKNVPGSRTLYLCVENQNEATGITTHLRVSAFKITKEFSEEVKENMHIQVINAPSGEAKEVEYIPSNSAGADSAKLAALRTTEQTTKDALAASELAYEAARIARDSALVQAHRAAEAREAFELAQAQLELAEAQKVLDNHIMGRDVELSDATDQLQAIKTAQANLIEAEKELNRALEDYDFAKEQLKEAKKSGDADAIAQAELEKKQAETKLDSLREEEIKELKKAREVRLATAYQESKQRVEQTTVVANGEIGKAQAKVDEASRKLDDIQDKMNIDKQLRAEAKGTLDKIQGVINSAQKLQQSAGGLIQQAGSIPRGGN